jgi:GcrA cell cycle regulator
MSSICIMTTGLPAATVELRATLDALGIPQQRVAELFGVGPRSVRRWRDGDRRVPCGVRVVLHLLAAGTVTISQVEAAIPTSAGANGGAKPAPPTPLLVESAPARAEAAAFADPGPTAAEQVLTLTADTCHWPYGDPGHPGFRFCGDPVAKRPYCEHHTRMAYRAPLTGGGRVAHGCEAAVNRSVNKSVHGPR